jgi:hypothetical protein
LTRGPVRATCARGCRVAEIARVPGARTIALAACFGADTPPPVLARSTRMINVVWSTVRLHAALVGALAVDLRGTRLDFDSGLHRAV